MRDDGRTVHPAFLARSVMLGVLTLGSAQPCSAEERLIFETGQVERNRVDGTTLVHTGLLQVEITPNFVLSVGANSGYRLVSEGTAALTVRDLIVSQGEVRLVALDTGVLYVMRPGRYAIAQIMTPGAMEKDHATID